MATVTTITGGVQSVSTTGAVGAGVSIAGITGDITLCVEVISMTAGKTARIQFEDSTNAFTAVTPLFVFHVIGQEGPGGTSAFTQSTYTEATEKQSVRKYQLRNNLFGTASAVLRPNVIAIDGSAELAFNAWYES